MSTLTSKINFTLKRIFKNSQFENFFWRLIFSVRFDFWHKPCGYWLKCWWNEFFRDKAPWFGFESTDWESQSGTETDPCTHWVIQFFKSGPFWLLVWTDFSMNSNNVLNKNISWWISTVCHIYIRCGNTVLTLFWAVFERSLANDVNLFNTFHWPKLWINWSLLN